MIKIRFTSITQNPKFMLCNEVGRLDTSGQFSGLRPSAFRLGEVGRCWETHVAGSMWAEERSRRTEIIWIRADCNHFRPLSPDCCGSFWTRTTGGGGLVTSVQPPEYPSSVLASRSAWCLFNTSDSFKLLIGYKAHTLHSEGCRLKRKHTNLKTLRPSMTRVWHPCCNTTNRFNSDQLGFRHKAEPVFTKDTLKKKWEQESWEL